MGVIKTEEGLKRVVGLPAFSMSIVNNSIGSGMFVLPAIVGMQLGAFGIFCYIFCGIMLAAIMLCYAEAGSRITTSGGSYAYIEAAFGSFAGFIANWLYTFGWGILGSAAVVNVLADSLSILFPVFLNPVTRALLSFILIASLALINIRGAKDGARFVQILTVIKLLPLFMLIILGLGHIKAANLHWEHLPTIKTFGDTALVLFFAFAGFEISLNASGELKNPKRTVPLGIFLGGICTLIVYLLIQTVTRGILGDQIAGFKDAPLAAVAENILGSTGKIILILAAAFSCLGILSGDILATPRLLFAGAKDGLFPKFLGKVHPKFATPHLAVVTYTSLIFIFSISGGFKQLAVLASAAILLVYLAVILSAIKLRKQKQDTAEKTFRVPGGLIIPFAGMAAIVWLLTSLSKWEILSTIIFVTVTCVIYVITKKFRVTKIVATKTVFFFIVGFSSVTAFSQINFSNETKKYIEYYDSITVFKNALLIDGKGDAAKPHQTIIISNGKINWVGDDAKATIPKGANTIDLNGKSLMPGLVMLHEHMYISAPSMETRQFFMHQLPATFPRLYLAAGATTIRTAGNIEPYADLNLKKDIEAGKVPGPSIEATAPYMDGNQSPYQQLNKLDKPENVVSFVNYWADQGFTSFKGYMFIDKATLKAAIDAVHKRKLKITAHLCAVTYREAAEMGIDQLEHGFLASTDFVPDKKENECPPNGDETFAKLNVQSDSVRSFLKFLIDKKTIVTSTLAVFEGFTTTQPAPSAELLSYFSPDSRDFYLKLFARLKSAKAPNDDDKAFANNAKMEKMFYDMGGLLTVGTDPTGNGGTIAGFGNWRAIELLVEADGFTPLQAIKIATLNGAIALRFDKTIGTIETGKSADLLIIDSDPSRNISDIRKVIYVFKNGVGYNSKKLFESVKGKVGFN